MSGSLPDWIQRLLGIDAAASGEGTVWSLEHSWSWAPWLTLVFAVIGSALIGWLYRSERGTAGRALRTCLAGIRIALIGLVLLMLAEWMLSMKRTGLPYLVIAVDDSGSMSTADVYEDTSLQDHAAAVISRASLDKASRINLAKALLLQDDADLLAEIDQHYKVRCYAISEGVRSLPDKGEQRTAAIGEMAAEGGLSQLGRGVRSILNELRGSPPAAILLLTDGITTEGETLLDVAEDARSRGVPLFVVGLGDDRPQRDLQLAEVVVDDVVFAGDVINFEVAIRASGLAGQSAKLQLRDSKKSEVLAETTVRIAADDQPQSVLLPYRPETGQTADYVDFDYVVQLETLPREINIKNNQRSGRVRIYNKQIQVLLVQAYPSYEFRYLQDMLARDETIRLHTVLQEADARYADFEEESAPRLVFPVSRDDLFAYDVVIFGDVDPALLSRTAMQHLNDFVLQRGGGVVFVAGPRHMPLAYRGTPLEPLLPVNLANAALPATGSTLNEGFNLEPTELGLTVPTMQIGDGLEDTMQAWKALAKLHWYLRAPDLKPAARVLAVHPAATEGADGRKLPLISIQYVGAGKVVFHAIDATWLWRFRVGDLYFGRYWIQTIRYLSRAKLGQEGTVELTSDRREYHRGDSVRLRVRFLNDEQAPASDEGVSVLVEQDGAQKQQLVLRRSGAARGQFEGTMTGIAEGEYRARIIEPPLSTESSASFAVQPPPGEMERLQMNSVELERVAKLTRGRFYRLAQSDDLVDNLPRGRQVPIDSLPPEPLWNKWPVLLLFLSLLTTEWILRKRSGML
jgi:hypothetical protein